MLTENQPLPSPSVIGFVGLGSMGSRMARNLARKLPRGQRLVVFDVSQSAVDSFLARTCGGGDGTEKISVTVAESAGSLAVQADLVFSALPGPAESRPVYEEMANAIRGTGKGGVGKVFVECGTVGPACVKWQSEVIESVGGIFVDCPMSGGIGGAAAGTLTFMVAIPDCHQPPQTVDETTPLLDWLRPWLSIMGEKVYITGKVGTGQTAKLLNNLQEYASLLALSESLLIGTAHGLPPGLLTSIFNSSTGGSWISHNYNPAPGVQPDAPASRDYALPGFPVIGAIKDLSLALELARDVGLEPRIGEVTYEANRELAAEEKRKKLDYTVIYEHLREKWGL